MNTWVHVLCNLHCVVMVVVCVRVCVFVCVYLCVCMCVCVHFGSGVLVMEVSMYNLYYGMHGML